MDIIKYQGIDYMETGVITEAHVNAAVALTRFNGLYPWTMNDVNNFHRKCKFWPVEAVMLYHIESDMSYSHLKCIFPASSERFRKSSRARARYVGLVFAHCDENEKCVKLRTFCRDPWTNVGIVADWLDEKLMDLSKKMKGMEKIRVYASETDTELQQQYVSMGYKYDMRVPDASLKEGKLRGRSIDTLYYEKPLRKKLFQ